MSSGRKNHQLPLYDVNDPYGHFYAKRAIEILRAALPRLSDDAVSLLAYSAYSDPNAVANVEELLEKYIQLHGDAVTTPSADINSKDTQGNSALILAAQDYPASVIQLFIRAKADCNLKGQNGATALMECITNDSQNTSACVKLLIENGHADPDLQSDFGDTALMVAASKRALNVAEYLVTNGTKKANLDLQNNKNVSALIVAADRGHEAMVKLLLSAKANPNLVTLAGETALHKAVQELNIPIINMLIKAGADVNFRNPRGDTPLITALKYYHWDEKVDAIVAILIAAHANLDHQDSKGMSALHYAICQSGTRTALALINAGANINLQENHNMMTPLYIAVQKKDMAIVVRALLDKGARLDLTCTNGYTPLHMAVSHGNEEIASMLIAKRLHLDIQNNTGDTALIIAVENRNARLAASLLDAGADPHIANNQQDNALDCAILKKDIGIVGMLLRRFDDLIIHRKLEFLSLSPLFSAGAEIIDEAVTKLKLKANAIGTPANASTQRFFHRDKTQRLARIEEDLPRTHTL